MQGQPTRYIAFVVLLLCVACVGVWHGKTASAAPQPDQIARVYFPIVYLQPQQVTHDLQIVHMGLYQSVQNSANGVTLIAHKPALLRVYAQAIGTTTASPVASVTVDGYRGGKSLGSLSVGPQTVSHQPTDDDINSTFNFDLPLEWLEGQVKLVVTVDKGNAVTEISETNNARESTFDFHDVPALDLTIVPIHYVDTETGITFSEPAHDPISEWLLSAFPVSEINVTIHAPFIFTGNLRRADEWDRLLRALTAVWGLEVGSDAGRVYYGLVPNSAPGGESWFEGGISGFGWTGQRVSIGLNVGAETGESAGHEIGHNFGRSHAPCGNPSGIDPHFPYPNASIGVYGVDTTDETLLDPNLTHDMMSYCGPEWVSDYTYEGLYQDQLLRGGQIDGASGEGLLLRAAVEDDAITALPVYSLNRPLITPRTTGEYQVQLVGAAGETIATYPATIFEADEIGVSARMLMTYVPAPTGGEQVGSVRFLRGGAIVAERVIDSSGDNRSRGLSPSVSSSGKQVVLEWDTSVGPALIRFSADDQNWSVVAFDVTGGRLEIERDQLPATEGRFEIVPADGGTAVHVEFK